MAGLRRTQLADISPYGSIAQRNDPRNYGSIASRTYPGAFGSTMPTQEEVQDKAIQANNRTLTLRNQQAQMANPDELSNVRRAQQIYQNNQALSLRRQNYTLNPPDLFGGSEDDGF